MGGLDCEPMVIRISSDVVQILFGYQVLVQAVESFVGAV